MRFIAWERLQDKFYRNIEGFYLQWGNINVSEFLIASAPYGGAIALTRDDTKPQEYRGPEYRQLNISIYSGAGQLIRKLPWDNGRIRGMGWSVQEQLIVVSESGNARCYYDFEGNFTQFSLGKLAESVGVVECKFYDSGFVALLTNNVFVSVSKYDDLNPRLLSESLVDKTINCWAVIPPDTQVGQHAEVLVSVDNTVYLIDTYSATDKYLEEGPFSDIVVSPNGEFISLFTQKGHLFVITSDFHRKLSDIKASAPDQLLWCGNQAVALVNNDEILLVGPQGGTLTLYYDGPVFAITEIDGMRTITSEKHDFYSIVPDTTVNIFRIGSVSPAAILLDCVEQLENNSPKADENLQIIKSRLSQAVTDCIEAAGYEFEAYSQKSLLKAASFGKAALDLYDSDFYVSTCDLIRLLNVVRQIDVGLLISYTQLASLTPEKLIDRLLLRRQHLLAFKCTQFLKIPQHKVFVHWACSKIRVSQSDDETVCREIVARLSNLNGVSYEEIAKTAYEEGRTKLAIMLTQFEPQPAKQVPLLLNMNEQELALDKAIESYDHDLIIYVLLYLQERITVAAFFRSISEKPVAAKVFEAYCRSTKQFKLLEDFFYQDDRRLDSVLLELHQAPDVQARVDIMKQHDNLKDTFGKSLKLVNLQQKLESDYQQSFLGLSVSDTISSLLNMSQGNRAHKVKDEFKVPEKRYHWLQVRSFVYRRDWDALFKFATSKKSPIGYEPFYYQCLKAGSKKQALRYVSMCTNVTYEQRIDMYIKVDGLRQAGQEALKAKDLSKLEELERTAEGPVATEIKDFIRQLK